MFRLTANGVLALWLKHSLVLLKSVIYLDSINTSNIVADVEHIQDRNFEVVDDFLSW